MCEIYLFESKKYTFDRLIKAVEKNKVFVSMFFGEVIYAAI